VDERTIGRLHLSGAIGALPPRIQIERQSLILAELDLAEVYFLAELDFGSKDSTLGPLDPGSGIQRDADAEFGGHRS
jgi:hypothetical protein